MTIQETLKAKMKEAGITQEEIGRRLGIAKQNVNHKLNNPDQRFTSTLAIAEAIGLSCKLKDEDGLTVKNSDELITHACITKLSTEAFKGLVEAAGWTLDFEWKQPGEVDRVLNSSKK